MKVEDAKKLTSETASNALRRGVSFLSSLQASDGHWPAENAGPLFFLPPLVFCLFVTGHLHEIFTKEHRREILRYIYCHQVHYNNQSIDSYIDNLERFLIKNYINLETCV